MEEKESQISGSPENTESGSPTPISGGIVSVPPETASGNGGVSGESMVVGSKKKRGRPRKYDADGNLSVAYAARAARKASQAIPVSQPPGFTLTPSFTVADSGPKRGRAKSAVSTNLQPSLGGVFADTAGIDFTPYIITVQTGEDVAAKINSVGQNGQKGPRGVCVLSANGSVSSVTISQPGSSAGGLLTYEGRFEILSLSGSYTMNEANGVTSRNGGLSITLAGPDGRVFGGSVAGWITAAYPIQVVVGSFVPYAYKEQKRKQLQQREYAAAAAIPAFADTMPAEIANHQQPFSQVREVGPPEVAPVSAQSQSEADDRSIGFGHNLNVVSPHHALEWNNGSQASPQRRIYPDINVSVPGV